MVNHIKAAPPGAALVIQAFRTLDPDPSRSSEHVRPSERSAPLQSLPRSVAAIS